MRWTKQALAARVEALGTAAASYAFDERVCAKGWLRRQWGRADRLADRRPG